MLINTSFQGDASQLSPPMKPAVQPSSKPYTTQSPTVTATVAPLTSSHPNIAMTSSKVNSSGGVYQSPSLSGMLPAYSPTQLSSVPQTTFLAPSPSMQPNPPRYSLSPERPPPSRNLYSQPQFGEIRGPSPNGPFTPKTAAELGLLDRPDTSLEAMELSAIVDRMTTAFPLDVHSGNCILHILFSFSFNCTDSRCR